MARTEPIVTTNPQLFRDVFNSSPVGIVVENMEGQPLFVNPAFCGFLGFSEDELHRKHRVDFSPPEDAAKDWSLFQQLRAGSIDHYRLEKRYFRKDGSLVWGGLSISLLNSRPSPLVIAIVDDITAKKTAEESRFRHAAIVESTKDAIISKNLAAIITSWNAGAERMFGYTEAEAVGQPITIIIPPYLQDEEHEIVARLSAGGRIEHYETKRLTKTGKTVDVSLTIGPIKDATGNVVGFSKIAHDVTARKQAEEALSELNRTLKAKTASLESSEELLKIFVKNVPAGVAMLDREMRYLQVSDRWCADYSVDSSQVLGRSHYEIFPDVPDRWKEVHRRGLEGETLRSDEDRWDRTNRTTWVRWEIRPWKTAAGTVGGILIFAEDITQRKQMEVALSKISHRVIDAHEEERRWIGRELHDDINQKLAMLAIEMERWSREESRAKLSEHWSDARKRITEVSMDVQALSHRLHSSKLEYLGLAGASGSFCREVSEKAKVDVRFSHAAVPSTLSKEVSLCLFRVLQEALQNAIKHSGATRFHVNLRGTSDGLELTVSDEGRGFDEREVFSGEGLGLISMRERLLMVRGVLEIKTQPGAGTTIFARIPVQTADLRAMAG